MPQRARGRTGRVAPGARVGIAQGEVGNRLAGLWKQRAEELRPYSAFEAVEFVDPKPAGVIEEEPATPMDVGCYLQGGRLK